MSSKLASALTLIVCLAAGALEAQTFRRADSNIDTGVDLSDAIFTLRSIFIDGVDLPCASAADANDDGWVNISDPSFTLNYLFLNGEGPPAPGVRCGVDPTADALSCERYPDCGFDEPVFGQTEFETPISGGGGGLRVANGFEADAAGGAPAPPSPQAEPDAPLDPSGSQEERDIEESDIYKLVGDHLFILNRYRGLQILDISDLDAPRMVGHAPIFGFPREMYVREGRAYVIVSDYFRFWRDDISAGAVSGFYGSQLRILDVSDVTNPAVIGGIDLAGTCDDSRIVGDVLYLVSRRYAYQYGYDTDDARNSTEIVSVSIADPGNVQVVDREDFERQGWEHHISVTQRAIFLAETLYDYEKREYSSRVHYVDIEHAAGSISVRDAAEVPGRIQDRWSMDAHAGVLRVASGQSWGNGDVYLTTYSIGDPDTIRQLGSYTLRIDERLTSARFDGNRGYLVSYRNIDPLFVFDLTVPSRPRLLGELEMSGWLDFMVPMGDRILALGHEDLVGEGGRREISLAVSLIDVSEGEKPTLLSRVALDGRWGSVPGDRDDFAKVFQTVPSDGLVVFPFRAWDEKTYRMINGVQLIDFDDTTVVKRGLIEDAGWVERSVPHSSGENGETIDTVLTISNQVFQSVDITNRDEPAVRGRVELARNVIGFATLPGGEYGVELSGDWYLGDIRVAVTPLSDPNTPDPISEIALPAPYGRMFTNGSMVYVSSIRDPDPEDASEEQRTVVDVVDLSDPAAPVRRGTVVLPELIWPSYHSWYWGYGDEVVQVEGSTLAFRRGVYFFFDCFNCRGPIGGGNFSNDIHVVDLSDPDNPEVASSVTIENTEWAWGLRSEGTTLYLSSYTSRWLQSDGYSLARYMLHRVDVAEPASPDIKTPVNIPGMFVGADEVGERIYTLENRWEPTTRKSRDVFYALFIRDDKAHLQSKVELPTYTNSVEIDGDAGFAVSQEWFFDEGSQRWRHDSRLLTLDLSVITDVRIAGRAEVPFEYGYLRKVEDGRAFVGSWAGVFLYDVRDIDAPRFQEFFRTQGWAQDIVVHEDRAFLPTGYYGVQVLDLSP